jgi:hypothetical protein
VEGFKLTKPGKTDKEMFNTLNTESESAYVSENYLEETGTEVTDEEGEGIFTRDAFFASYPELATGAPVEGAIIMIAEGSHEHPDIAAQSDEQGTFYLPNIQLPGTYTLLINYSNESKRLTVNLTKDSVLKIPL